MKYKHTDIKQILCVIMQVAFLVVFAALCTRRVLGTTKNVIEWPLNFYDNLLIILKWTVRAKVIIDVINKKYNVAECLFIAIVLIVSTICFNNYDGYKEVIEFAYLLVGMAKIDFRWILRIYLFIELPITVYTIIQALQGNIENLIYYRGGHARISFGFNYPTDFSAHIFFMLCAWVLLRRELITIFELAFMSVIMVALLYFCDARCSFITIAILVIGVFFVKYYDKLSLSTMQTYIKNIVVCVFPIFMTLIMIGFGMTDSNNKIVQTLNKLLSQRIVLSRTAFEKYNIKLWGQYVQMRGYGGTTTFTGEYFWIDCSYINILLRFGLAMLILVLSIIEINIYKNINNNIFLIIVLVICLHSVIEHHLFEFHYNFLIIAPLTNFAGITPKIKKTGSQKRKRRKQIA